MKSRILVCGGRNYWDRAAFLAAMQHAQQWFEPSFCIIQGGANGADHLAKEWAIERRVPVLEFCAPWGTMGKQAGKQRNSWMLLFGLPDLVIAFPGHSGTANMIAQAKTIELPVWEPYA